MRNLSIRRLRALLPMLALSLGWSDPASAGIGPKPTLDSMVSASPLIFVGTVEDVQHRLADVVEPGDSAMPHTYVTYAIERTLKGRSETPDRITLRFQGGLGRGSRYLRVTGLPLFDVGDRDVIFVGDTGNPYCPLQHPSWGRLRIFGSLLTNEQGQELLWADGDVLPGRVHPIPEILTHQVGPYLLRQEPLEAEAARGSSVAGARLDPAWLMDAIEAAAGEPDHGQPPVRGHHVSELLRVEPPVAVAPPSSMTNDEAASAATGGAR